MTSMEKQAALVLAAGSLGDALLTLPALRLLQSRTDVTVAGTTPYLSLGSRLLGIHEAVPLEPLLQALLSTAPLESSSQKFLTRFHEIFIFFKEKDNVILEKLAALSEIQVHFPQKSFAEFLKEARWAAEYWLETAFSCPLSPDSPFRQAKLLIDENLQERGREILRSLDISLPLIIHPGSGSPSKNAPLSFFRTAAERAGAESGKQVLVVWGEAEEKNIKDIRQAFSGLDHVKVLPDVLPLKDLASVFSQSVAYLGNDSGITQLASACGLRTFAVFNSTDSSIWGPQANFIILNMLKGNLH
jgi:ADP-heptose:LPS heptosyltransferase